MSLIVRRYKPTEKGSNNFEWHINFADYALFGYYGGHLFAQDEMQVMEHPNLGSIREAALALSSEYPAAAPYTKNKKYAQKINEPTPVLIQGVKRNVRVEVGVNRAKGRPFGLYGNNFAFAEEEAIVKATTVLDPPTTTNIIAMEAPKGGTGKYSMKDISNVFSTAYSSFACAVYETKAQSSDYKTVIHTGNWGTGAYGGNKISFILQHNGFILERIRY